MAKKSKTVIIPQRSGNGSIHDIASPHYDRDIVFPRGHKYAVVLANYYGDEYTTHTTARAAIKASDRVRDYIHRIIGVHGEVYDCTDGEHLEDAGSCASIDDCPF